MVEDWWLMCCQARSGVVRCRKTGSIVFLKYYCTPGFFFLECERPLFCHLEFPFLVLCPVLQPLDCKKSSSGSFYVCLFISPGCRTNIFYTTYLYGAYKSIYPWSLSGLVIRLNVIHLLFAVYTQLSRMYCINFVWLLRAAPNIKLVLLFNKGNMKRRANRWSLGVLSRLLLPEVKEERTLHTGIMLWLTDLYIKPPPISETQYFVLKSINVSATCLDGACTCKKEGAK